MNESYIGKDFWYFKVVWWPVFQNKEKLWVCICECGNKFYRASRMFSRHKRCVECKWITLKENPPNKTHWLSNIPEYRIWVEAKYRCIKPQNAWYKWYWWRWITMSEEWIKSFDTFIKDMWYRPSSKHSIDRIDVNKWYCKENCKWSTNEEQANNKRITRYYNGKTLREISNETGINYKTLRDRTDTMGLSIEEAITKENRYFRKYSWKTINEWCLLFGIKYTSFYRMAKKKWWYDDTIIYYKTKMWI